MTTNQLIDKLINEGGAIVSSNECSDMEIAHAQAHGRFAANNEGFGFVLRYREWLNIHKDCAHRDPRKKVQVGTPAPAPDPSDAAKPACNHECEKPMGDEERCDSNNAGWCCTMPKGHTGLHVACACPVEHDYAHWSDAAKEGGR